MPALTLLKGIGEVDNPGLTINYTLYVEEEYEGREPLGYEVRCPGSRWRESSQLKLYTHGLHYSSVGEFSVNAQPPTIRIYDAPRHFNVGGKGQVRANSQTLTYFYDDNDIWVDGSTDDPISLILASLLILTSLALLALSAYICYKKWKRRAESDDADFELGEEMENTPQGRQDLIPGK